MLMITDYRLACLLLTSIVPFVCSMHWRWAGGGVWINDISTVRHDHYPYGGVKKSGFGLEGVAYAIQEMTELKFLGIKLM
jgi:acyl-CoA reductase-like NAD-dependent aldehyde dehydrogenase